MSTITVPQALLQQALEALESLFSGQVDPERGQRCSKAVLALRTALAQQEQICNCRWVGDVQTQQCTLHEAHVAAIHEWAERAKTAEAALAQQEQEPVTWGVDWGRDGDQSCCTIIKRHADGIQEVVAVEYGPPRREAEQEPVAYTGDVALRMREAGMTFHLGMPHAAVMEQMTRFHDLVCAEASIKAAAAFATPPRREWVSLTEEEIEKCWDSRGYSGVIPLGFARAIEAALKEKNHE